MARPIIFNSETICKQVLEQVNKKLATMRASDGKFNFNFNCELKYKKEEVEPVKVLFTPLAYIKTCAILEAVDYNEVTWNGTVERRDEHTFVIKDIVVEPQIVAGATAEGYDDERRLNWWMELPDEVANSMHMHAHSHVRMAVTPSATDEQYREDIISQLKPGGYYIFMIWNKRYEHSIRVYDIDKNIVYEDENIELGFTEELGFNMDEFVTYVKGQLSVRNVPSYGGYYGRGGYVPNYANTHDLTSATEAKPKYGDAKTPGEKALEESNKKSKKGSGKLGKRGKKGLSVIGDDDETDTRVRSFRDTSIYTGYDRYSDEEEVYD